MAVTLPSRPISAAGCDGKVVTPIVVAGQEPLRYYLLIR
jgi:hypothetical protein